MLSRPRSVQHETLPAMLRKAVDWSTSFLMMRMRPGCSTTNTRFGSSGAAATSTGFSSPAAMRTERIAEPATVGTPAQTADAFSS